MKKTVYVLSFVFAFSISAYSQSGDVAAVKQACLNYIHTFYNADTTLAYKSVHTSLRKTGFYFQEKKGTYTGQLEMPFGALVNLAKTWNADGTKTTPESPKEVEIFEVADKTAIAKVTAVWGIDYLSLAKMDGQWMIVNVLWQSPPKKTDRP